jgi:hypothetical protein
MLLAQARGTDATPPSFDVIVVVAVDLVCFIPGAFHASRAETLKDAAGVAPGGRSVPRTGAAVAGIGRVSDQTPISGQRGGFRPG